MVDLKLIKGTIFSIQHYCIHDGPGIRTNIFVKGCPLRCLWCQNPESQLVRRQVMFDRDKCTGCQACIKACLASAIELVDGKAKTNRKLCIGCGKCAGVCNQEARTMMGEEMTAEEAFRQAAQDQLFYEASGGGVTMTGGEALAQPEFTKAVLQLCKDANINTAIETCGFAKWDVLESVLEYVDVVLYDLKHMDTEEHKKCTGVGNELILENLKRLSNDLKKPVIVRTPIIPGYNDSKENITAMANFLSEEIPTCIEVNLLPYHNLGEGKNEQLEAERDGFESFTPTDEKMAELMKIIANYHLIIK